MSVLLNAMVVIAMSAVGLPVESTWTEVIWPAAVVFACSDVPFHLFISKSKRISLIKVLDGNFNKKQFQNKETSTTRKCAIFLPSAHLS